MNEAPGRHRLERPPDAGAEAASGPRRQALDVVVLLPCRNEESAVADTIRAFRTALPNARLYVYDNGSTDRTAEVAAATGVAVRAEPAPGKGNVVRRMFADIEADIYVLADGDGTYEAAATASLIEKLRSEHLDMVVGVRQEAEGQSAYRTWHRAGNTLLNWLINTLFGGSFTDVCSGFRAMSRRFVKSFASVSKGFEIETEMSIHCLQNHVPCAEFPTRYVERAHGSVSKLRTWRDGSRILFAIAIMLKEVHPLRFFAMVGLLTAALAIGLALPIFLTYLETGLVPRLPTAVLCLGLGLVAGGSFLAGIILDSMSRGRYEAKRLAYLLQPTGADLEDRLPRVDSEQQPADRTPT